MMTLAPIGTARLQRRSLHRAGAERSGIVPLFGSLVVLTMLSPPTQAADVSADTSIATGGTAARTLAARAADVLNPLDFVDLTNTTVEAVRTGAYDASPAFIAAIESRPAGSNLRLVVPSGTYRLNSTVTNRGRYVTFDLSSGAKVGNNYGGLGNGVIGGCRIEATRKRGRTVVVEDAGSAGQVDILGTSTIIQNIGTKVNASSDTRGGDGNAVFGETFQYLNLAEQLVNPGGGDVGRSTNCEWRHLSGRGFACRWTQVISPKFSAAELADGKNFAMGAEEINVVNNGPETGFTEYDAESTVPGVGVPARFTGGFLFMPDIWRPEPGAGYGGHTNYGIAFLGSFEKNNRSTPYRPKTYAPVLIGANAIAPGGRGIFVGGSKTFGNANNLETPAVSDHPRTPLAVKYAFSRGLDLTEATFDDGRALALAPDQTGTWGEGATKASISADMAGKVTINAPGGFERPADTWTAWTPTVTPYVGTVSGLSSSGTYRYVPHEKRVDFTFSFTATPSQTTAGFAVDLPVGVGPSKFVYSAFDEATGITLAARSVANGSGVLVQQFDGTAFTAAAHTVIVSGFYQTP